MMVKVARHCGICRRFRPTRLQVHHIVERSKDGTHDEENLIVVCLTCHSDVHTQRPFARRFTVDELKGHRDAVVHLVASGDLPTVEVDSADFASNVGVASRSEPGVDLLPEAVEVLVAAAQATGDRQGRILAASYDAGIVIIAGNATLSEGGDRRREAAYSRAVRQLHEQRLIEPASPGSESYWVTHEGWLLSDELASASQ